MREAGGDDGYAWAYGSNGMTWDDADWDESAAIEDHGELTELVPVEPLEDWNSSSKARRMSVALVAAGGALALTAFAALVGFTAGIGDSGSSVELEDVTMPSMPPGPAGDGAGTTETTAEAVPTTGAPPETTSTTETTTTTVVDMVVEAPPETAPPTTRPDDNNDWDGGRGPDGGGPGGGGPPTTEATSEVPSVFFMTEGRAASTLSERGLEMEVNHTRANNQHEHNRVMRQDPMPGADVSPGSTVTVTIARHR